MGSDLGPGNLVGHYALPSTSGGVRAPAPPHGAGVPSAASGSRKGFFTADYLFLSST